MSPGKAGKERGGSRGKEEEEGDEKEGREEKGGKEEGEKRERVGGRRGGRRRNQRRKGRKGRCEKEGGTRKKKEKCLRGKKSADANSSPAKE